MDLNDDEENLVRLQGIYTRMRAEEAWDLTTGSRDVVVAVIDSRLILENKDIINNFYINQEELQGKFGTLAVDVDGDGRITFIDLNHLNNFNLCGPSDGLTSSCDIVGSDGMVTPVDLVSGARYSDPDANNACAKIGQNIGDVLPPIGFENGVDDDQNGRCDDLIGWDFDGKDNYPGLEISATNAPTACTAHGQAMSYIIGGLGERIGSASLAKLVGCSMGWCFHYTYTDGIRETY